MLASNVVRINRTLYVRIPAADARRLGLKEGDAVDMDVRRRGGGTARDVVGLRGSFKGAFRRGTSSDLWGF